MISKIAICITGIDRSLDFCINSLKENLINCNEYEFHLIGLVTTKNNEIDDSYFNFLKINQDSQLPNLSYQQEKYKAKRNQHIQCYYQLKDLYEVNKIRIEYEIINDINFDYIIRYRTDFNLLSKIDLSKITKDVIYMPHLHDHTGYNDRFAIGDRYLMNIYFNRYLFWLNKNEHIKNYNTHAEKNLKIYLNEYNINVDRLDFNYALRRNFRYHPWVKELYNLEEVNADGYVNGIQYLGPKNIIK
jgi:hypothetical protein